MTERRDGHSKLVYDKASRSLKTVDPHPETRTVHDPFLGKDVQISNRLVDRLRGRYASGPHLPNGNPEFGWRQFQAPPIQHEAAAVIDAMAKALVEIEELSDNCINAEHYDAQAALEDLQAIRSAIKRCRVDVSTPQGSGE